MVDLRSIREQAQMTQVQLAAASGVSLGTIQRIEKGELDVTTIGTVKKLCAALGTNISNFFADCD